MNAAVVQRYIDEGIVVLPVKAGEKETRFPNWPNVNPKIEDFSENDNVARRLDNIVDVDNDCPEAIAAATELLLTTGLKHGRPSAGTGHYFYVSPGSKAEKFKDHLGQVIVEIRTGNHQYTLIPPSILARKDDPTQTEQLVWTADGAPGDVDAAGLRTSVVHVAIVAYLARLWPTGSRHVVAGPVAGFLSKRGLDPATVERLIRLTARIAGDEEVEDRARFARETAEKFHKGDAKIAGGPKLAELIGDGPVKKLHDWLDGGDAERLSRIETLNSTYAMLTVGNKVVVAQFGDDQQIEELFAFEEFKKKLIKEPPVCTGTKKSGPQKTKKSGPQKGEKAYRSLAGYWLEHPTGRRYDRLVYAMPGSRAVVRPGDYNGWQGLTVTPAPGDWSENRGHMFNVICSKNTDHFHWLLNWSAALIQAPGRHGWAALVLRGGQGVGKGHFADQMLGKSFHQQQYLHLLGANQLTAEFNEHFSGKVLVFGDETCWGGEKQAAGKVKGLITEDTVIIHRKFLKAIEEPSALHFILASNSEWPIPIDADDRRYFVLDVSEAKKQDDTYFSGLRAELENGGRAAMLHELQSMTVDWPLLRHPPDTDAKRDVKELTLSAEERWLQNELMDDDETWTSAVAKSALYARYERSVSTRATPKPKEGLGKFLRKLLKKGGADRSPHDCKITVGKARVNGYEFPDRQACRDAFDKATGAKTKWPPSEPVQPDLREA